MKEFQNDLFALLLMLISLLFVGLVFLIKYLTF